MVEEENMRITKMAVLLQRNFEWFDKVNEPFQMSNTYKSNFHSYKTGIQIQSVKKLLNWITKVNNCNAVETHDGQRREFRQKFTLKDLKVLTVMNMREIYRVIATSD